MLTRKVEIYNKADCVKRLMNYIDKLGRLIADENYPELEYTAECCTW